MDKVWLVFRGSRIIGAFSSEEDARAVEETYKGWRSTHVGAIPFDAYLDEFRAGLKPFLVQAYKKGIEYSAIETTLGRMAEEPFIYPSSQEYPQPMVELAIWAKDETDAETKAKERATELLSGQEDKEAKNEQT